MCRIANLFANESAYSRVVTNVFHSPVDASTRCLPLSFRALINPCLEPASHWHTYLIKHARAHTRAREYTLKFHCCFTRQSRGYFTARYHALHLIHAITYSPPLNRLACRFQIRLALDPAWFLFELDLRRRERARKDSWFFFFFSFLIKWK